MDRILFLISAIALGIGIPFAAGLYCGAKKLAPYHWARQIQMVFEETPILLGTRPIHWTSEKRYEGNGVTIHDSTAAGNEVIMLQGFFEGSQEIRLIEMDGTVLKRWPLSPSELTKGVEHLENRPNSEWRYDTHGAAMLDDGSVLFNIDYIALVRLDICGDLIWRVDMPTHHSVEPADDGTIWLPGAIKHIGYDDLPNKLYQPPFAEDILVQISLEGKVLNKISLIDVFLENEAWGLLTLAGASDTRTYGATRPDMSQELFHANDVEALPASIADAFPDFQAGDLLISLRNRNLILVIDPETLKIKWQNIGPWVRQHDADWHESGTIRIFDNYRDGTDWGSILGSSRIIETNPATNTHSVLLGKESDPYFHTTRRGKHQQLSGGRMLITEAEHGRVFMTDSNNQIIWNFQNVFDDEFSARISEARAYKRDYFKVESWACAI